MAQGLRALLTDDARRAALGRAAAAFVRAGRSIGAAAERLEQALARVTADPAQK
jgi:hypothetical protein